MRSAPPVSIDIVSAPHWRGVMGLLCAVAIGLPAVWAFDRLAAQGWPIAWAVLLVPACAFVLAARALSAAATARGRLHWDGEHWWFAPRDQPQDSQTQVDVTVQIDLGAWMLLHARYREAPRGAPRSVWLPLQRSVIGGSWLALRRALFAGRPMLARRAVRAPAEELRDER